MSLNSTRAHNKRVCVTAIDTADLFGAMLLKRLLFPSRGTGRISRGSHTFSLFFQRRVCLYRPQSAWIRRTPQTKQTSRSIQTTAIYFFPMCSFTSTLTGPFHLFSEFPNLLWSLE